VAEITRKLYRQSNADAVLSTTVNEIGSQWKVSRCIAAMCKPGLVPTSVKEFCGDGVKAGEASLVAKVATAVQELAIGHGTLAITDAPASPELQPVREAMAALAVTSLLALPLSDGQDQVGLLLLIQNTPRGWHPSDLVVLKTISDQIVIALNNASLRRLVKNLSVTDERSGLMKRASYLDLLMAETRRAIQQSTPISVLLMQFGKKAATVKEFGEAGVTATMEQIGQLFAANIRQNDLAFRYETTTIAIVLGETAEPEGLLAVQKLRKLLGEVRFPGKEDPLPFSAGLAEAVIRPEYDAVDIVTEIINRAELALDMAIAQGAGRIVALPATLSSAAVA
jgi:GGDEF domain-containing protein